MRRIDAGGRAQVLQHAQRAQAVDRRFGEAEVALVEHRRRRAGRRGFHQRDAAADAVQRDGKARAHQPAADDGHIETGAGHGA